MPRQDVPYGGAICRLRERIAEIFDKLGEKLHTINGVPGDGDGNVKIVSGSSAVVISNDPTQNEIAVSLDTSQLPAASVSSVNGQTGAVALDAEDIPTVGGDVQADLQDLANDISGNTAAINAEALARQGADSALQTNINNVSASLPAAAAAAVAADPTVAQLATDVPNKVDKITSGSSLKAYTHTGATQGETSVVDGTAANSIGIRDANGRMQAADPASGATNKTLVTANWVSQTGDSGPNNLLHRSGNERKTGVLTTSTPYLFRSGFVPSSSSTVRTNYHRVLSFTRSSMNNTKFEITIVGGLNNTRTAIAKVLLSFGSNVGDISITPLISISSSLNWCINIKLIRTANTVDLWIREAQFVQYCAYCTVKYGQYVDINSAITGLAVGDMATSSDPSNEPDTVATITVTSYSSYPIEV